MIPANPAEAPGPAERYRQRHLRFEAEARRLTEQSRRISWGRGLTFLPAVAAATVALVTETSLWWWPAGALLAGFFVLALWHDRVLRRERVASARAKLQCRGLARLERRFADLPIPETPSALSLDPKARDLDLFGRASLMQLVGSVASPPGRERLAGWLVTPAPAAEIPLRQQAARELGHQLELREELELAGEALRTVPPPERFLGWAEGKPWLADRPWLLPLSRLLVVLCLGSLALALSGVVSLRWFPFLALTNLGLMQLFGKPVFACFDRVEESAASLLAYGRALAAAGSGPFESPLLRELATAMSTRDQPAAKALSELSRILNLADARRSGSGHPFLVALFQWDFQVLALLERWQRRHGGQVRGWLEALGQFEALAALGQLHYENPEWCFPEIRTSDSGRLEASGLGHPLLPQGSRVDNDVALGPAGTFLLITGSNMSGKSTLLRSLGLNVTLAQAGGPACARHLSLPPVVLGTSLLVEDSLSSGVSFFMAELQRLKAVVELSQAARAQGRTLLFLLDEVLRGTNSAERRIAVRRVLLHLAHAGAIGALTTHDLALAEDPELAEAAQPVHFRETLNAAGDGPPMTFDYRLRPGVATTVNALRLLELVGLGEGR